MKGLRHLIIYIFLLSMVLACAPNADESPTANPPALIPLQELKEHSKSELDAAVSFLSKAVRFNSVEDFGYELTPETRQLMDFVLEQGKSMGFSARKAAGGLVGILEYGSGDEVVGVLIHLDVVPASEATDAVPWDQPPFSGKIVDGEIWGRGTQDDKGALAAVLYGAKILIDNDLQFKRKLRIILGTKEEKSFESLTRYFSEEPQPDFGLVTDGVFTEQGEKGIQDIDLSFPALASDASASARDTVVHWSGGSVINTVPNFSYFVIKSSDVEATRSEILASIDDVTKELKSGKSDRFYGVTQPYDANIKLDDYTSFISKYSLSDIPEGDLVVHAEGVAAHGANPWLGKNAIVEVALIGSVMSHLQDGAHKRAFEFVASKIGLSYDGSGLGIPYIPPQKLPPANGAFNEVQFYGTSTNLGLVGKGSNQDEVTLSIDFRSGLENDSAQILSLSQDAMKSYHGTAKFQAGIGSHYDPFYYPADDPLLQLVRTSYKDLNGGRAPYLIISAGSTYMKLVENFINFGPVDIYPDPSVNRYHQKNERTSIESVSSNITLYAHTLQKLIQVEKAPNRVAATSNISENSAPQDRITNATATKSEFASRPIHFATPPFMLVAAMHHVHDGSSRCSHTYFVIPPALAISEAPSLQVE